MKDFNKLYSETIKALNREPYHFEKRENVDAIVKAYNPVCGDRFELFIRHDANSFRELHFHGFGCSVSKASTSVLARLLENKTTVEALMLCNLFLNAITAEVPSYDVILPAEFIAFSDVRYFPERVECAALPWREMKKYLEEKTNNE